MPELAFEPTPQKAYQPNSADVKYLNSLVELQAKQKEIEEKIDTAEDDEKKILEINLEDIKKRIRNYRDSLNKYRKTNKFNSLRGEAGEQNVAEIIDFKKNKRAGEGENQIGSDFLNSLEEFKADKQRGAQLH